MSILDAPGISKPQLRGYLPVNGFGNVISALTCGISSTLVLQGDSTGNEDTEWFHLLGEKIGSWIPSIRVEHKLWNHATQEYDAATIIQAASGPRYLDSSLGGRQLAATDVGDWTTDLDLRVKVSATNWGPSTNGTLVSRYGSVGSRAFRFYLTQSGGNPFAAMEWKTDGTNGPSAVLSSSLAALVSGSTYWLRVTLDVDNGGGGYTVHFYYSTDGITWTDVGVTTTAAGITSVFKPPAQSYAVGARDNSTDPFVGQVYACQIRDGIAGPIMTPQPIDTWRQVAGVTSSLGGSPTLHLYNGSMSGQGITYLSDVTRLPFMVPPVWQGVVFMSTGHNENQATTRAMLDTWLSRLRARVVNGQFCVVMQNPRISPATQIEFHAQWAREFGQWAIRNDLHVADVYRAFYMDPRGLTSLVNTTDGIHPVSLGSQLWRDTVAALFDANR